MSENFIDFRIVKQRVSIQAVLDHYSIRLRRANQTSLRGKCPLPTHQSKTSTESFGVQTAKNIWSCQSESCASARQGKRGGNVLDFVSIMENCSIRDAAAKLHDWFIGTSVASSAAIGKGSELVGQTEKSANEPVAKKTGEGIEVVNKPLSFTLKDVDPTNPYVRSRGMTEETARHFGIGFFPGRGSMGGRCVIPIHNERGELVAYAGRAIDATEPKYKLPAGFHKSLVLYNLHQVKQKTVVVVEGFFDCMRVSQAGYPCVAVMGSTMSTRQEELLVSHFAHIVVMLDGDDAGRKGTGDILLRLGRSVWVKAACVPDRKQPDEMTEDEIRALLR